MIDAVTLNSNSILPNLGQSKISKDNKMSFSVGNTLPNTDTFESKEKGSQKVFSENETGIIIGGFALAGIIGIGLMFGKNKLQYLKNIGKIEKIDMSPQIQKCADYNKFKNFKICENLKPDEKKAFHNMLNGHDSSEFYTTLMGKRAVGEIYNFNGEDISYLAKLKLPKEIELLHSYPSEGFNINREYCVSVVNKPELFKIFDRNREVFTKRLGLNINADNETIYAKIKDELRFKDVMVDNVPHDKLKHDLYGMCMGYPKYNTMIFQLESTSNIPCTLRKNPTEYKKQILEILHSENSPYRDLSKKELRKLEKAIHNIKRPHHSSVSLYGSPYENYIEITPEKNEFKRIRTAAKEFNEIFSVDKMINGIYS